MASRRAKIAAWIALALVIVTGFVLCLGYDAWQMLDPPVFWIVAVLSTCGVSDHVALR